ncbi:J domain-containing protein [Sphingomonas paeninsulae]|uniref:J domain-containing protein n=1 Tax=Sphingomonas paeninsulae TaxID=2319844 RepID=A0A494TMD7_SPHPE|nr:J domain-containing protein [Sphingomonas paeninsulae]AYJ86245.1 J domain-containing protein [Sphingomonas paeninsulae]
MIKLIFFGALLYALYYYGKRYIAVPGTMGKSEAAKLLGLSSDASSYAVIDAHRRLITKVHPDAGGSVELASRINQARDVMLRP